MLAALIGILADTAKLAPFFPQPGESLTEAVARVRPVVAIVLDASLDEAGSDVFLAHVRAASARLLLFGSVDEIGARSEWARKQSVPTFVVPAQVEDLMLALQALQQRPGRGGQRRAQGGSTPDDKLVFQNAGVRWYVYDRRSQDRRAAIDRRFVSEEGEVRHCLLSEAEAGNVSEDRLSAQLARST